MKIANIYLVCIEFLEILVFNSMAMLINSYLIFKHNDFVLDPIYNIRALIIVVILCSLCLFLIQNTLPTLNTEIISFKLNKLTLITECQPSTTSLVVMFVPLLLTDFTNIGYCQKTILVLILSIVYLLILTQGKDKVVFISKMMMGYKLYKIENEFDSSYVLTKRSMYHLNKIKDRNGILRLKRLTRTYSIGIEDEF